MNILAWILGISLGILAIPFLIFAIIIILFIITCIWGLVFVPPFLIIEMIIKILKGDKK